LSDDECSFIKFNVKEVASGNFEFLFHFFPVFNRGSDHGQALVGVDATGRMIRPGKRGRIDPALAPILARLDLSVEGWLATMCGWRMFGASSGIGRVATRKLEAARRGVAWIRNRCAVFAA